jgi:hypothetical protein
MVAEGSPEFGLTQEAGPAPILANGALSFEQQSEAVLEGQCLDVGDTALFLERVGHAGELEFMELGERLFDEHGSVRVGGWRAVVGTTTEVLMVLG